MAGFMDAYKSGYEAVSTTQDDTQARKDLQQAYEKTPSESDPKTGEVTAAKDMFKVNSLAAQMAARQGNLKAAEKFDKQAQESKSSAMENQLNDIKVQQAKFGQLERMLQTIKTAKDGEEMVLKSDLPDDQKMRAAAMFKEAGDDPKKVEAVVEKFTNAAMDGQHRSAAANKYLTTMLAHQDREKRLELLIQGQALSAQRASGKETPATKRARVMEDWHTKRGYANEDRIESERTTALKDLTTKPYFGKKPLEERQQEINDLYDERLFKNQEKYAPKDPEAAPEEKIVTIPNLNPNDKKKLIELKKSGKLTPELKKQFDQHYGKGAADKLLKGQ